MRSAKRSHSREPNLLIVATLDTSTHAVWRWPRTKGQRKVPDQKGRSFGYFSSVPEFPTKIPAFQARLETRRRNQPPILCV